MQQSILLFLYLFYSCSCLLQKCPDSYFFDAQHCQSCSLNCKCSSKDTCQSCIDGYTMLKGICTKCPVLDGIYGECSSCCSHETGTSLVCTDCKSVTNYYSFLFSGRCILSQGCFEVDNNGFCIQCHTNYYQFNNQCYSCHISCKTCISNTSCLTCSSGYYWKIKDGSLCQACNIGCSSCDSTGNCYSCLNNYYLFENYCQNCPIDCLNCLDSSICTSCIVGILVSNLCIKCTDNTYGGSQGCLSCYQSTNFIQCSQCNDTYYLDTSTGTCKLCSIITGTQRCKDQNTPTQCLNDYNSILNQRYYLVGITCIKNINNCRKILNTQALCGQCYNQYLMLNNFTCQLCSIQFCNNSIIINNKCICQECQLSYYANINNQSCIACTDINCSICTSTKCISCILGYYWSGTKCLIATANFCSIATSATQCSTCLKSYYKGSNNQCLHCQQHCLQCSGRFHCTICQSGYHLHQAYHCIKIPNNCHTINTKTLLCQLCQYGHYLIDGFCLSCTIEAGTLSKCQGLCPIDYYIQSLLKLQTQKYELILSIKSSLIVLLITILIIIY